MSARKLKRSVLVYDAKEGRNVTLPAGETVPTHLRSEITNPDAYEDDDPVAEGFGEVEQSGPYVGLSRDQMVGIAGARGLKVPDDADTGTVLGLVVDADAAAAKATADAEAAAAKAMEDAAKAQSKAADDAAKAEAKVKAAAKPPQQ